MEVLKTPPFMIVTALSLGVVIMIIGVTIASMFKLKPRQVATVGRSAGITLYISMGAGILLLLFFAGNLVFHWR